MLSPSIIRTVSTEIQNDTATSTLTDGIAKRYIKSIVAHQYLSSPAGPKMRDKLFEAVVRTNVMIGSVKQQSLSKNKAIKLVNKLVNNFFIFDAKQPSLVINKTTDFFALSGYCELTNKLFIIDYSLDKKKPHKSFLDIIYVGITTHALSRLLFRAKPDSINEYLSLLMSTCEILLHVTEEVNGEKWVYFKGLGAYLFKPALMTPLGECQINEKPKFVLYDLITFVGENLLRDEQIAEFDIFYEKMKEADIEQYEFYLASIDDLLAISNKETTNVIMKNHGVDQFGATRRIGKNRLSKNQF